MSASAPLITLGTTLLTAYLSGTDTITITHMRGLNEWGAEAILCFFLATIVIVEAWRKILGRDGEDENHIVS